nr:lipase member N-like [Dermacentor andersoni]
MGSTLRMTVTGASSRELLAAEMGTFTIVATLCLIFSTLTASSLGNTDDELKLQAHLSPCELIKYHGYPCELSYAATDDGYVIEVDHIPHGREGSPSAAGNQRTPGYPVLLLPVFTSASDMWFLNYPSQSPGFLLVDRGFDVWSMNSREVKLHSNHTTLSQDDHKYWRWSCSFDEIGRYDTAACVDHVLEATGAPKLTLMALSQGVVTALVLLSTRPEYNEKVDLVIGYGPVANITHSGPPISVAMPIISPVLLAFDPLSKGGYLGSRLVSKMCNFVTSRLCPGLMTLTHLSSPLQLNKVSVNTKNAHEENVEDELSGDQYESYVHLNNNLLCAKKKKNYAISSLFLGA